MPGSPPSRRVGWEVRDPDPPVIGSLGAWDHLCWMRPIPGHLGLSVGFLFLQVRLGITDLSLAIVRSIVLEAFNIFPCSVLAANLPDMGSWVDFPKKRVW